MIGKPASDALTLTGGTMHMLDEDSGMVVVYLMLATFYLALGFALGRLW